MTRTSIDGSGKKTCLALFMTTSKVNWQLRAVDWHVMHKLTQFHPRLCIWISPSKFANIYGRVMESKARCDIDDRSNYFHIWRRKLRKFTLNFTFADFPVLAFRAWKIHFRIIDFTSLRWRSMNNWAAWNIASIVMPIKSFDDEHSCRTRNPGKHCDSKNDCTSHSQVNRGKNSRAKIYVGTCHYRFVNVQHLIRCEHVELKNTKIETAPNRRRWTQLYQHEPTAAA